MEERMMGDLAKQFRAHTAQMKELAFKHNEELKAIDSQRVAILLEDILNDPKGAIRELAAFVANERVSMINLCYPIVEEDKTSVD
tara:strand:- start:239 stop:493 length:255 start_codon:yes stop_codon:yes gene_type:complete